MSQPHRSAFSREPSPFHDCPHEVSIQKAKRKDQKYQKGSETWGGPTRTPLQATSSRLPGEVRGELGPRGSTPISSRIQRLRLSSASQHRLLPSPASQAGDRAVPSVLIDSKNPDAMELGQLGDEHTHQGHGVEDEMDLVILGIEAGEEVQHNGGDG